MRLAVVANPSAGRGKAARLIPRVRAALASMGLDAKILTCADPSDPPLLARAAAEEGAEVVAALGGDGQVGACANGLMGTDAALAVIPAGSGNDFARNIGLDPKDPLAAVRLLADPVPSKIDVIGVKTSQGERSFVNVGGVGFDSEVTGLANRTRFPIGGTPKYVYSVFATLARFRPAGFRLELDGRERSMDGMLVAVGNGPAYGGGMRVLPEARLDDGALDVCVLGAVSKLGFIRAFPRVFKGTHVTHPAVSILRGSEVSISADRAFDVYADGERMGPLPATFTVNPGALSVVAPGLVAARG